MGDLRRGWLQGLFGLESWTMMMMVNSYKKKKEKKRDDDG